MLYAINYHGFSCTNSVEGDISYCAQGYTYSYSGDSEVCCLVTQDTDDIYGGSICGILDQNDIDELSCEIMGGNWLTADERAEGWQKSAYPRVQYQPTIQSW